MTRADEEWLVCRLAEALRSQDMGRLPHSFNFVNRPGGKPACYVPDPHFPSDGASGTIVLNMAFSPHEWVEALVHEHGHHLLSPPDPNCVFERIFPLDRHQEAALLRERIVQQAERLCFGG